jgi:hypothetical protein
MPSPWRTDHDPEARPLGCNGAYGPSGRKRHARRGEPNCQACKDSDAHYARELRRGQHLPRYINPCGTPAAARRHRYNDEPVDLACADAEAAYHAANRAKHRKAGTQ